MHYGAHSLNPKTRALPHLCLLPLCSYQTPRQHNLRTHRERVHGTTQPMTAELRSLPLLADYVLNRNQADPGSCLPSLAPLRLPIGSLPHSAKPTLQVRVQVILGGEQVCEEAPAPQSHPSPSGVVPETQGLVSRRMRVHFSQSRLFLRWLTSRNQRRSGSLWRCL